MRRFDAPPPRCSGQRLLGLGRRAVRQRCCGPVGQVHRADQARRTLPARHSQQSGGLAAGRVPTWGDAVKQRGHSPDVQSLPNPRSRCEGQEPGAQGARTLLDCRHDIEVVCPDSEPEARPSPVGRDPVAFAPPLNRRVGWRFAELTKRAMSDAQQRHKVGYRGPLPHPFTIPPHSRGATPSPPWPRAVVGKAPTEPAPWAIRPKDYARTWPRSCPTVELDVLATGGLGLAGGRPWAASCGARVGAGDRAVSRGAAPRRDRERARGAVDGPAVFACRRGPRGLDRAAGVRRRGGPGGEPVIALLLGCSLVFVDEPCDTGPAAPDERRWRSVASGGRHSCGIDEDGAIDCWGADERGQLEAPGGDWEGISAGYAHSCAVDETGTVACWGDDEDGESSAPGTGFASVSAGGAPSRPPYNPPASTKTIPPTPAPGAPTNRSSIPSPVRSAKSSAAPGSPSPVQVRSGSGRAPPIGASPRAPA